MHEPTQKCENNAIFKQNHCLKLFIAYVYNGLFLGEI